MLSGVKLNNLQPVKHDFSDVLMHKILMILHVRISEIKFTGSHTKSCSV